MTAMWVSKKRGIDTTPRDTAGGLRDGEYRHGHDSAKCEADTNGQFKYGGRPSGGKDQSSRFGGSSGNSMGDRQDGVRIPTCYKCGKKGHKRPECPSWVITPTRKESLKVDGKIGVNQCSMTKY